MRHCFLLLILLGACGAPGPGPASSPPAGARLDTPPRAQPATVPSSTCSTPHDPEGWIPLGDAALPPGSVLSAGSSNVAMGFDETGSPIAATLAPDGAIVIAAVREGALRQDRLPRKSQGGLINLAIGAEPEGAVFAATTDLGKLLVIRRRGGAWQESTEPVFCMGSRWDAEFGLHPEWPELTIDSGGHVWQACLVRSYSTGSIVMMPSSPPLRDVRLRLGRLSGSRWQEVDPGRVVPNAAQSIALATSPAGEVLVRIGSADGATSWSGVVPIRDAGRGAPVGPISLVATPGAGTWIGGQGTGWMQMQTTAQTCSGATPCRLVSPDATLALPGYPLGVARRGDRWIIALHSGGGLVSLARYDRNLGVRPLVGAAASGVSATPGPSIDPAIALDACGQPTVFWSEDGQRVGRTFADGQWRSLPSLPGPGPHGLLVGAAGEVYVGAWGPPRDDGRRYTISRIAAGAVTSLPPLALDKGEWTVVDIGRTRLSFDSAIHVAFPLRDNALSGAHRVGYVLHGEVWEKEQVPASLVDAPSMPWTTSATADQSALAIDERGQRIVVWSKGESLGVARWSGSAWDPLAGGDVPAGAVAGTPAIAASGGRVCVAWGAPSGVGSGIFVRCHRGVP